MTECYDCKDKDRIIDDKNWTISRLRDKCDKLERENNSIRELFSEAEHTIKTELNPRIEREKRSYDRYVLSGGSDECFHIADSGNCGVNCPIIGERDYCFDNVSNEDLLKWYVENDNDYIRDQLISRGLYRKAFKISDSGYRTEIKEWKLNRKENRKHFRKLKKEA